MTIPLLAGPAAIRRLVDDGGAIAVVGERDLAGADGPFGSIMGQSKVHATADYDVGS